MGKGREMWLLLREQQFRKNRSNTGRVCVGICERDRKTKQLIGKERGLGRMKKQQQHQKEQKEENGVDGAWMRKLEKIRKGYLRRKAEGH